MTDRGPAGVVTPHRSDEHADPAVDEAIGIEATVFERFVAELQREALLRVDRLGLAGRDAEVRGVE